MAAPVTLDAIVLAGGRAARLGGVDKPGLIVGDRTILGTVIAAAASAGAVRIVVVGTPRSGDQRAGWAVRPARLLLVQEDPPQAGPGPAICRGLAEVRAPWTAILAGDLPFLAGHQLSALLRAAAAGPAAGCVLADDSGQLQWLAGVWRTAVLRQAAETYQGRSARGLLGALGPAALRLDVPPGEPPPWLDCDTPAELAAARAWDDARPAGQGWPGSPAKDGAPMSSLADWTTAACAELGLSSADVPARLVLDLARDVAHGVQRPAAPLTAYLLGVAVGQGQPADDAAGRLRELAAGWADGGTD